MKSIAVVILALACVPVLAQTALVVQLSAADAAKAKQLYDSQLAAEKAYQDFQTDVGNRYVSHEVTAPATACAAICTQDGCHYCTPPTPTLEQEKASHSFQLNRDWWQGFIFSEDFKFIVPRILPPLPTQYSGTGCVLSSPVLMTQ
jgi:hypothetical protein